MALREHHYRTRVRWTGNLGTGTSAYGAYGRDHLIAAERKSTIAGSSDPVFRGDPTRWNPEELVVAALAACHQLVYLHLCAEAGVVVTAYEDDAEGVLVQETSGSGQFTRAILRPRVTVSAASDSDLAASLHRQVHAMCFIARSVSFPVECQPMVEIEPPKS